MKGFTKLFTAGAICCGLLLSSTGLAIKSIGAEKKMVLTEPSLTISFAKSKMGGLGWAGSNRGAGDVCVPSLSCHELRISNTSTNRTLHIAWEGKRYVVKGGKHKNFTIATDHEEDFKVMIYGTKPDQRLLKTVSCSLDEDALTCHSKTYRLKQRGPTGAKVKPTS